MKCGLLWDYFCTIESNTRNMKHLPFLLFLIFLLPVQAQESLNLEEVQKQLQAIQTDEIKTACGCCDGMEKIAAILIITTERFQTKKQMEKDNYASIIIELTNQKTEEVAAQCISLGFNDADILECPSFESLNEKSKLLNQKFRN